ncbi:MAG TPA: DUF5683 domain-containing protein [Longimicrobiales bacterium]|nr:DUF5683 domain-containing protein [Longimicrobiales bacterium]
MRCSVDLGRGLLAGLGIAAACAIATAPAAAQAPADPAAASDTLTPGLGGPSPTGALARSFVLPGWGQLHVGSNVRGLAYLAVHGVDVFMLVKTFTRLEDTRDRRNDAIVAARDSILTQILTDTALAEVILENPDTLDVLASAGGEARRLTNLTESRRQQREDWMVWAGFWIVASGIDAFVAAHLADFPAEVDVRPVRDAGEARMEVGLRVPLGRRR